MNQRDVAILGGGLAGLTLALQLKRARPGLKLVVIERNRFPVPEAAHKVGESTVEVGADYLARRLGLLDHIQNEQLQKFGLRFFFGNRDNADIAARLELGVSRFFKTPSYQFDRGRLENHLCELVREMGVEVVDGARVRGLDQSTQSHRIELGRAGTAIGARWVVDASGRAALLKRQLGLRKRHDHNVNAVWFRVAARMKIDDWSDDPEWQARSRLQRQRWLSTNHLMGSGYWVWIIPLSSGSTSIGIVSDPRSHPFASMNSLERALGWLSRYEPQCAEAVSRHPSRVQDFLALKNFSYDSDRVFLPNRIALTGEAGAFLDPFYSPGSDFIAISNTFIADLIQRDFEGESTAQRASIYDQIYLSLVRQTLCVYRDQYVLFGNQQIMPVKILWDYLVYWSVTAYLYFKDCLTDLPLMAKLRADLDRANAINQQMQRVFQQWVQTPAPPATGGFIDQADFGFLSQLNAELTEQVGNREAGLRRNLVRMERVSSEILRLVERGHPSQALLEKMMAMANPN